VLERIPLFDRPSINYYWATAQTYPLQEPYALGHLERQNVEAICPSYLDQITNIRKPRIRPLFPGYIFFKVKENENYNFIHNTYGILRLLTLCGTENIPAKIPDSFIDSLEQQVIAKNKEFGWSPTPTIPVGTKVRVKEGNPFFDHTSIVTWSKDQRIKLLFCMLGGEHELEFHVDDVEILELPQVPINGRGIARIGETIVAS
jgi:transcriptional antiterminator RfaH